MSGLVINNSNNIASLDSRVVASLCEGKLLVDLAPSVFIGAGAALVLGASVKVVSPTGVTIKNYPTSGYDIANDSPSMSTIVEINIPTQASNFQYGTYLVTIRLVDEDGTAYETQSKPVKICHPDKNNKVRNYGCLSAVISGDCKIGSLFIDTDTPPNYQKAEVLEQTNDLVLEYPTGSTLDPVSSTIPAWSVRLYEGIYKVTGTICATYAFDDNVYVDVLYKVKKEKNVKCSIDECAVAAGLSELNKKYNEGCSAEVKKPYALKSAKALLLLKIIQMAIECGSDPSEYVIELEDILGCPCTCSCNEATPFINNNPAKDFVFTGCGFTKTSVGLTDHIEIFNRSYVIFIADNGGILTADEPSVEDCLVTIPITFNISRLYGQVKILANADYLSWSSIVNKSLNGIDVSCLDITDPQWAVMTLKERMTAIMKGICSGGTCNAEFDSLEPEASGNDVILRWFVTQTVFSVDILLDGVFKGSVLKHIFEFKLPGAADGLQHEYMLIAKNENGSICAMADGLIQYSGCATIAPPTVTAAAVSNGDCPYDLTALLNALPSGIEAEWHKANNTDATSLVADPTTVADGVYYVFAKNSANCYSLGIKVTLVCSSDTNCSAPQNIQVESIDSGNRVRFDSAAFAPLNYTVKRRRYIDPDVDGSYTTIGTPTWNASVNKWEITDTTAVDNTLYVYRAISNCTSTAPFIDYQYANIVCPTLDTTLADNSISYSFVPVGGQVDKYEVEIKNLAGTTLIHTDTHLPAFSNPVTGSFIYLDPSTSYKLRIKIYIGTYVQICNFKTAKTTTPVTNDGNAAVTTGSGEAISAIRFNSVDVVSANSYVINDGSNSDLEVSNKALAGTLQVDISGHTGGTHSRITVTDSNGVITCLPITGNGTYSFSGFDIVEGDAFSIDVMNGGVCPT